MNIYGNDGNLIFGEGTYEITDTFNDVIEVKTNKNGIFRVKLSFCDGMDVKVMPNDITVVKEEDNNTVVIAGKTYKFVKIDNKLWLTENLDMTTTNSVKGQLNPQDGSYYPSSDIAEISASLPDGWHVPTATEAHQIWELAGNASYNLFSKDYPSLVPNTTDEYGLSLTPGGYFSSTGTTQSETGLFFMWTSTPSSTSGKSKYLLIKGNTNGRTESDNWDVMKFAVRLCKDA